MCILNPKSVWPWTGRDLCRFLPFILFLALTVSRTDPAEALSLLQPGGDHVSSGATNLNPTAGVRFEAKIAQSEETESRTPVATTPDRTVSPTSTNAYEPVCQTLMSAAQANDLPLEFLTRLIWQESRFDAHAISPKGAQGVAQFMPKTAAWVGLTNPFDVVEAITRSGELLQNLRQQFGNLGLAAAAYNAGPKRVQDWLSGRRNLPRETEAYVRIVTGHVAHDWTKAEAGQLGLSLPESVPCPKLVALFGKGRSGKSNPATVSQASPPAPSTVPPWGVQLIGDSSQISALASFQKLQNAYKSVLGTRQPYVLRSQVGRSAYWYRVRVATDSLKEAENLCSNLRAVGGSCLVQRN